MSVIVGTIVFRSSTSNNSAFSVCSKCVMCTCLVSTPSDHAYHTYYLHMHNCSTVHLHKILFQASGVNELLLLRFVCVHRKR